MRIQDKVVVITGGASGLGQATARHLVEDKGAKVALFDLNIEAGNQTVEQLGADRALFVEGGDDYGETAVHGSAGC